MIVLFQLSVGKLTIEALSARHGTQYVTGNSAEVICKYLRSKLENTAQDTQDHLQIWILAVLGVLL